ncbi:MAG: SMC family ATPase [Sandaracinaceae bacterium]|nr:SMC family ATPase [Sandaracinaceae bacterium]
MRPLCLEMTAFGPFAGTQVIDFRELGAAQLFLICGETGSGKSAILDGLCAALYGESSGGERTVQQLRSDHADPKVATTLRLDFRVGEHTYRIERTPAQQRAKLRGEGYVEQAASATLWRLASDAPGALVAEVLAERKVREVDARVLGLVKLEAAQFRRVVVLPQGDFRQLLSADSQAREKLLEKLFDTVAFKRVEEALALRAKKLGAVIRDAEQRRAGLLASQGETSVDVLVAKVEGHERALPHLTREAQEAGQRAQEAVTHLADGRQLAQRFEALRSERAQEAELEAREPAVQQERVKLGQARAAEAIAPVFDAARRAAEQLDVRAEAEAQAQDALREVGARQQQAAEAAREAAAQHQLRAEREAERAAAEARAQAGRDWATRRKAREAAEVASTRAQEACVERERAHQAMTQDLDALGAQRVLVAEAAAQLARAEADLAVATGRLALHRHVARLAAELDVLEGELTNAQQQQHEAAAALDDASAALRAIEAAMHAGHAAVLARELRDGEPCPVCGSAEHPAPAETLASTPTEADHAAAERSAVKAREVHAGAATRAAAAEAKRDAKRSELHAQREPLGSETLGQVEQSVTLASATLTEAKARVDTKTALDAQHATLEASVSAAGAALTVAREAHAHATAHHDAAKREEALALAALGGEPADVDASAARAATLKSDIAAAEAAHEHASAQLAKAQQAAAAATSAAAAAAQERETATAHRDQAATAWAAQLAASSFPDEATFTAARLPAADTARLEASVSSTPTSASRWPRASPRTSRPLTGRVPPDLTALEQAATAATAANEAATKHQANVKSSARRGRELVQELERALAESQAQEAEHRAVAHLSAVASGNNSAKMNLHRFVLAAFLEEVLTQANQHLQLTSQGRYELVRRAAGGDARRAQGLDLDVHDHYTGEARASTTLSGGEGFLAALALALGLADVVRAHFGGVPIETVFIDEGFGSLDPETLDLVIETLLRLQSTGRMVGIISHVPELRERVDVLLEVSKGVNGSSARFRVPG